MLILFAKYTLFMCLAIISNNSNCEERLIEASTRGGVYWKAACTAKCLLIEKNKSFVNCVDWCQPKEPLNTDIELKKINENHDLILFCRDDRSITLKVIVPSKGYNHQQGVDSTPFFDKTGIIHWPPNNITQEIYIVNISLADEPTYISVYLSNENLITIGNLSQNTTYNVTLAVVYSSNEYSIIAKSRQFKTLRRGYKPKEIQEISLLGFTADESDQMRVTALISWKPSYDMTCHYDLIYFSPSPDRKDMDVTSIEIRDPHGLYTYSLDNLTFATVYNVAIRAMNTNDSSKESDLKWEEITTPSCIEWHNENFNICAPPKPEGLTAEEHFLIPNFFSLNISWQHPKYEPDNYTLQILDLDQLHTHNAKQYDYNVSKDQNSFFIPKITLNGILFEVHLIAHTPGGSSPAFIRQSTNKPHLVTDRNYLLKLGIAILAPLLCILVLTLTIIIVFHRRAKLKRFQERCNYFEELEKKAPIDPKSTFEFPTKTLTLPPSQDDIHLFQLDLEEKLFFNDDMEINRSDVDLYEVLGEGAFGLVRKGIFKDSKNFREVAVKMLKDQPSVDDVRAFRREIEVMKSVGCHPNIVGIIGHCTRKCNDMLLLTEYCSFGNLLNFLRNEWKYLHELSFRTMNGPLKSSMLHQNQPHKDMMSTKNYQKLTKNAFNFDTTIAKKTKLKCKNISTTPSNASTAECSLNEVTATSFAPPPHSPPTQLMVATLNGINHLKKQSPIPPPQRMAKFNKSYGYEEICTNACKCRVDILELSSSCDTSPLGDDTKRELPNCGQIKISRKCECRQKGTNVHSIDNKSYYKNLFKRPPASAVTVVSEGEKQQTISVAKCDIKESLAAKREPLTATDLLEIAKQVALGMEFLSKNKVVHRDLAARNVLVSSDRTVKIADFGLSRDVYQENVYKKTGNGKLPIKWLALESMTHHVYTSQSDVWSFGILLYEIITLGGIPYPSIPTNRLLHLLKTGYRMEKPKHCGQGFYNLMMSCWNFNPADRPNFTEIIKILDSLLTESPQSPIEKLTTTPTEKNSPETPSSDESYLKPL